MNTPSASLMVMTGERFACVRVAGRANFASSVDFKNALSSLQQKGYQYVVIELSECALMDSTFLGVLAGFGLKCQPTETGTTTQVIELRNPNERLCELLENLGVLHLFKVSHGALENPEPLESTAPAPCNPTREELTLASLEAHRTLMQINPGNVERFKDVTKFLAEDLEKSRNKP
jgi:anti-anti-sigma regulatory factor